MRKSVKISLIVVGSIVAALIIAIVSTDIWVSRVANNAIQRSLSGIQDSELVVRVGDIHVGLLTGMVDITDIYLATDTGTFDANAKRKRPGLQVQVPHLTFELINYYDLLRKHEINLFGITVHHPQAMCWFDERHPELCLPQLPKDTTLHQNANEWLKGIDINRVRVLGASAQLVSVCTPLRTAVDSLSVQVEDINYSLADSLFSYSDSTYSLHLGHFYLRTPDGLSEVDMRDLDQEDAGELTIGRTRYRNIVSSRKLADKNNEPTTWLDLTVRRVCTSPLNPIRKAMAQDWTLDSLYVDVQRLHVIRDKRHAPKRPFPMPQEAILQIPAPFAVHNVHALARAIDVELQSTDDNIGKMHLESIHAQLKNITNKKNATWKCHVSAPFGKDGHVKAAMDLHIARDGKFDIDIEGSDIELGQLNSFLRPLVGITCESHVDRLQTHYSGDNNVANGEFLLMYHGLDVRVHKEDNIPYKAIQQNAGFIQSAANNLIPKSNPTAVDPAPRRYYVTWKRDPWNEFPLFAFGPCIDGVLKTMLPGLNVHNQVRDAQPAKKSKKK